MFELKFCWLLLVSVCFMWKMDFHDLPLLPQVVSLVSNDEDVDVGVPTQHDQTFSALIFDPDDE